MRGLQVSKAGASFHLFRDSMVALFDAHGNCEAAIERDIEEKAKASELELYRSAEANEIDRLRDLLDRISTAAPGAIPACNCSEGEACSRCETLHLLDIYNGRVPDGPYRRPQPVLNTSQPAT
jgi:hypothetical protein